MIKTIVIFLTRFFAITVIAGVAAAIIWYLIGEHTVESLTAVLFWLGAIIIGVGTILFVNSSDIRLAPRRTGTLLAIDPKGMAYAQSLHRRSEILFLLLVG